MGQRKTAAADAEQYEQLEFEFTSDRYWKDHPELYALTWDEGQAISRAGAIIDDVLNRHIGQDENGQPVRVLDDTACAEIVGAFKRKRIAKKNSVYIARRVLQGGVKWYSTFISISGTREYGKPGQIIHSIRRSDGKGGLILPEKYPDYYRAKEDAAGDDMHIIADREALHLTADYKYISSYLLYVLETLQHIFQDTASPGQLQEIIAPAGFRVLHQGPTTNELALLTTSGSKLQRDAITNAAFLETDHLSITIKGSGKTPVKLRASTWQLFDSLVTYWTEHGTPADTIAYPLTDYMKLRKLNSESSTRKQVTDDLEALYSLSISFRGKGRYGEDFIDMRLCVEKGIRNGVILFTLAPRCAQLLRRYPIMNMPEPYYSIDTNRYPHAAFLMRKIATLKNMNVVNGDSDIISVKTLLEAAPDLPRYEDIAERGKISRDIIEPFEKNMTALEDVFTWEYCHSKGEPLTEDELSHFTYAVFSRCLVRIHWKNYPDMTRRIERKAARIAEARAAQAPAAPRKRGRPPKNKPAQD